MNKKLLIIEDDKDLNDFYAEILEAQGFNVTQVDDGEKALEVLTEKEFDLILLDIMIPKIDGLHVLEKMHEQNLQAKISDKVIILTNLGKDETLKRANLLGVQDVYVKCDYTPNQILEIINRKLRM